MSKFLIFYYLNVKIKSWEQILEGAVHRANAENVNVKGTFEKLDQSILFPSDSETRKLTPNRAENITNELSKGFPTTVVDQVRNTLNTFLHAKEKTDEEAMKATVSFSIQILCN